MQITSPQKYKHVGLVKIEECGYIGVMNYLKGVRWELSFHQEFKLISPFKMEL